MRRRDYSRPELECKPVAEEFMTGSIEISDDIYRGDKKQGDIYSWNEFFS